MNLRHPFRLATISFGALVLFATSSVQAGNPQAAQLAANASKILQARCFGCHGANPEKLKGSLNISDYALLVHPARKLVIPGDPDGSELMRIVIKGEMPKGKPALPPEEQAIIKAWIVAGAPNPAELAANPPANVQPGPGPQGNRQPPPPPPDDLPPSEAKFLIKGPPKGPGPGPGPIVNPGPRLGPGPAPGPGPNPGPAANGGGPAAGGGGGGPAPLAARVQLIFTQRCFKCHGDKESEGGIKILDRELLVTKKKLVPGKVNESPIFKLVSAKAGEMMPPEDQPRLTDQQIADIRDWIAAGANSIDAAQLPDQAPSDGKVDEVPRVGHLGVEYTLHSILNDVRRLTADQRKYARYFSLTHILDGGATAEELTLQRQALIKAINHLTWAPQIVIPKAIEPTYTVYRIDIRNLGWEKQVYSKYKGTNTAYANFNLFDLALLEYPYGVIHENSDAYLGLVKEYFPYCKPVRPIGYIRSDWFVSTATLPPLYHDFLQLPEKLEDFENILRVNSQYDVDNLRAQRSGMTDSNVSRNNRVVERHQAQFGCYWKSFDFKTSTEQENMLKDPIDLHQTGGEMVFSLPNGMHGYYVCNAKGDRLDFAPTEIVVDKNATDKIVRNGLSCIRCHTDGIKTFKDAVRPTLVRLQGGTNFSLKRALNLYVDQTAMDKIVDQDTKKFMTAVERSFGKPQTVEPLTPVSLRFLDGSLNLAKASAEAGLPEPKNLQAMFLLPQFSNMGLSPLGADRTVHRDTWQSYYDRVIHHLGLGVAIVPLDGLTTKNYEPFQSPCSITVGTGKKGNQYSPGEKFAVTITPNHDVYIEVIATNHAGLKKIWVPSSTKIPGGKEYRYPPTGQSLKVGDVPGRMEITVYASVAPFPAGEVLHAEGIDDRVAHPFTMGHADKNKKQYNITFSPDPSKTVKRSVELEIK